MAYPSKRFVSAPQQVGRYELLDAIASGGMAKVYLARSRGARGFERHVALKVMHPHLVEDPEFVAMFLDEARMVANIRHPNVVPTLDVVEEGDQLFLVMEYIEGLSLQALVRGLKKRDQNVPLDCALRISIDMLMGLHAAHEMHLPDGSPMNIVHRDVSPHNVMVGIDGVSRIMDFGVARAENRHNSTVGTNPKGKLPYMSPEQLDGVKLDRRSDVYSAGIVVWEMLTGRMLFRADNDGALMCIVALGAKQAPIDVNPEVPPEISVVCMRALARREVDRYPTAMAFAEALENAARDAHVTIASPRAVGALVKEIPPERMRGAGLGSRPGGGSGSLDSPSVSFASGVAGNSAPVSIPSASLGRAHRDALPTEVLPDNLAQNPLRTEVLKINETGPTPLAAELVRQEPGTNPGRGASSTRRGILAAVAAVSLVCIGAWVALRPGPDASLGSVQPERSAEPIASQKATTVTPLNVPSAAPDISAAAKPTNSAAEQGASSASATSKTRPGTAPAPRSTKSKSGTFRPEEP